MMLMRSRVEAVSMARMLDLPPRAVSKDASVDVGIAAVGDGADVGVVVEPAVAVPGTGGGVPGIEARCMGFEATGAAASDAARSGSDTVGATERGSARAG